LARGLRRVAIAMGVKIFEKSPVTALDRGIPPVVRTPLGAVAAEKVILATNAWTAAISELRRHIIVVSSDMIATAPIPERLREIGWTGGESITDSRLMVHYHQVTRDGRIAIGRGSGSLAYLGRVTKAFNGDDAKAAVVERGLRKLYPALGDVAITHRWGGPIDRSRSGTLVFGRLGGNPRILYGIGYSGTGVAPSVVGGKILASTALDRVDEWSTTRLNQGPVILYPPDPIRFFGGLAVRQVLTKKEEGEEDGIPAGDFAKRVSALAYPTLPNGLDRSKTTV
ncbi:MAG: FAD-dependent oxidoreductase, partial [Thermomicrobiales bacterium]|nr:FAD-dependent oxidoreductase [Thermomicrobiales bacterium]